MDGSNVRNQCCSQIPPDSMGLKTTPYTGMTVFTGGQQTRCRANRVKFDDSYGICIGSEARLSNVRLN